VYPSPHYIATLGKSTPIRDHVPVDYELHGCPVRKEQLLEVLNALLHGRKPVIPGASVCLECKQNGTACVMVAQRTPCLGPVTRAGCGALCPAFHRGCYGCFGPADTINTTSLSGLWGALGATEEDISRAFLSFNAGAEAFRREGERHGRR
jgi:coenzyme F420-reducing hydrogenase gamma subunit